MRSGTRPRKRSANGHSWFGREYSLALSGSAFPSNRPCERAVGVPVDGGCLAQTLCFSHHNCDDPKRESTAMDKVGARLCGPQQRRLEFRGSDLFNARLTENKAAAHTAPLRSASLRLAAASPVRALWQ